MGLVGSEDCALLALRAASSCGSSSRRLSAASCPRCRAGALCTCANTTSLCCQLFWEKKLSGLNAFDIAEELVKTMDLPKGLQGNLSLSLSPGVALGCQSGAV